MYRALHLGIGLSLYLAIPALFGPALAPVGSGLGIMAAIAWLWVSEALHVSVTALLVPLLAVASGLLVLDQALVQFADPIIFLFLGGFALATGLRQQGLDRWLAGYVIRRSGRRLASAARALFWLTAVLSMWISNTATAAMMLPLALGLLSALPAAGSSTGSAPGADPGLAPEAGPAPSGDGDRRSRIYVLLGIAFAANIGGIGTLVGSPPNAIAAANAGIGFAEWLLIGLPLVLLMLPLMELALRIALRPNLQPAVTFAADSRPWGRSQWLMLLVFAAAVLGWVFGAPLAGLLETWFGTGIGRGYDALVAMTALVLLHALGLARWRTIQRDTDWGVLLLFGGGLTLSRVLTDSGAGAWLAGQLAGPFAAMPVLWSLLLMALFAMALTEVASNTASAALLIPLFIGLAPTIDGVAIAMLVAIATSCAFLLPVATPPNAIIFGSGQVPQRQMIHGGLWVTLAILPLLVGLALWLGH